LRWLQRLKACLRDDTGSELVEFALCATIFFTVMLGTIDVGRAMFVYHFVTAAAQNGSRYAMVRGASWPGSCQSSSPPNFTLGFACQASADDVQNYVRTSTGLNPDNLSVSTTWPGTTPDCSSSCSLCSKTNNKGCMVKVQVTYTFHFLMPFLPSGAVYFKGTSVKAIQQ
jgi:hypothetical protein